MASYENSSCDEFSFDGEYGTFPTEFQYSIDSRIDGAFSGSERGAEERAKILLMGLRGVGKSSILNVVFHKMTPTETLFLEGTNKIEKDDIANNSFVQFQIWDFPGQIDFFEEHFDAGQILTGRDAVVFVVDAQEEYEEALIRLHQTIVKGHEINPNLKFEVFIHKVDGLTDESKIDTQRAIQQRLSDELEDAGLHEVQPCFHLTSIYDHSVFEAFSKVVQKLIDHLPSLEQLLNILVQHSGVDKAFLFDVVSKIYIATDSGPVDIQSYELCCDMIDIVIDISCIYSAKEDEETNAYDTGTTSVIRLTDSTVCYLREVNRFMALVCIMREDSFTKQGLINYNFNCFREAIQQIFKIREPAQNSNTMSA